VSDERRQRGSARVDLAQAWAGTDDEALADAATLQRVLRQVPLFSRMSKRHLRQLADRSEVLRYRPGEPIVRARFSAEAFFLIASGSARVDRQDGSCRTIGRGDYFGQLGLIDGVSRNATVVSEDDVVAVKIRRQTFLDLLDHEPTVCRALVETLVAYIRDTEAAADPAAQNTHPQADTADR
jgi:CRP/FNR family transcriptional regulator, cyclic AMP receptor protein